MDTEEKPVERERNWVLDRISSLPEFLIHQILSYLPTKEAARTTVLSKKWLQSYSNSPILNFNESYFVKSPEIEENRYPFFDFVNNTLLRYTSLNLRIHKFQIEVFHVNHAPAYRLLLDQSLGLAFDNGVKELDISVVETIEFLPYTLPATIFHSPKPLTYLRVQQCKFPENIATTSNLCNAIIFPFLKILDLNQAYIDDGMLQKLLSFSPSLEEIVFHQVSGLNEFRATNLSKLKLIDVHSTIKTIEIDIEGAPKLRLLKFRGSNRWPCLLKVGSAPSLKHVKLHSLSISDDFLEGLITKSPLLEDLEIDSCNGLERINIVGGSLKRLRFMGCKKLVEVKIDAPSLLELHYYGDNMLSLSRNNTPEGLNTYISIRKSDFSEVSNEWFHQLAELLRGVTQGSVSFRIFHQRILTEICTIHEIGATPRPLERQSENIVPKINQSSSWLAAFVETLFSSSRPTTIHITFSTHIPVTPPFADYKEFLGSELIAATRNPNCCSSKQTKCWRHYLKDIKVKEYEYPKKEWPNLGVCGKKTHFRLKWFANLNAEV